MIFEFFKFELKLQRRQALYWITLAAMALIAFGAATSDAITLGGAVGNVLRNAPLVTINWFAVLSLIGMFLIVTFIASPLLRDAEVGSAEMLFSKPFRPGQLVLGRFAAGVLMSLGIYAAAGLAIFIGTFMPWLDQARVGPARLDAYLYGLLVFSLPNTLLVGAILAALAVRFRSMMAVYVGVLAVLVGYIVAGTFLRELDTEWIVALSDPFGIRAMGTVTRYWSAVERNSELPSLIGYLGMNRFVWLSISLALLAYAVHAYSPLAKSAQKAPRPEPGESAPVVQPQSPLPKPSAGSGHFAAYFSSFKLHTRWILFGVPFIVMLLFGMTNFFAGASSVSDIYGTKVYPVSYLMVDAIQGSMQWLLVIIVTFYAGELVWRERSAKMHEIVDASPIANWVPLLAKTSALLMVIGVFCLASITTAIVFQLIKGYVPSDFAVYFSGVALNSLYFIVLALTAIALQVITGNKFLGFGLVIGILIAQIATSALNLSFTTVLARDGFRNAQQSTQVVENGTFFNNSSAFPSFGYQSAYELQDRNERRKRGLGEPRRMPLLEDQAARANTYIANDADWIDFETIVSTDVDQIALSPGYLVREWIDQGRRYFHYKMDSPMLPFFAYLSARWTVSKGEWQGLPIEVYHDPKHGKNVQRMIESVQDSLDYFTKHFSPYQHRQVRIIEFPRYATFAQSFANTIPYSESIGFIANLTDKQAIDYVYYITAHEVAHQWWAHQVIGANMQGSTMLSESLAQYSSLMVMEKKYGPDQMRKFLRYELDSYLRGRATEALEELPLYRVENQPYVHYRKGALVFYRLKDEIGETALNAALAEFIRKVAYQSAPYTTSSELIETIRAHAPADKEELITDLFEKIAFYDNRVETATVSKRDDGRFDVRLNLKAAKLYMGGKGAETQAPIDDDIDIGVFSGDGLTQKTLYLRKHRITTANPQINLVVDSLPSEVGIDPFNKLIDRVSRDNRKKVTL